MPTRIELELVQKRVPMSKIKIFCIGFIGIFLMVSLKKFDVTLPQFSPSVSKKASVHKNALETAIPKLYAKKNVIELKSDSQFAPLAYASSYQDDSKAYEVVDLNSNSVLSEKNSNSRLPIASLTKIMTAVVALDLASPDTIMTVSSNPPQVTPTRIGLWKGEKINLSDLLNGLLITSGNDAATTIREGVSALYGEDFFIKAMNKKTQFLGLSNTHFSNEVGFDIGQNYSSAHDLAVLADYALTNYPLIAEIVKTPYQEIRTTDPARWFDLYNWNGLLNVYPGAIGMKIGNTTEAGCTAIEIAERDNKRVMVVVLGSSGILKRDLLSSQLLDMGFEKIANLAPANVTSDQLLAKYATWKYFE